MIEQTIYYSIADLLLEITTAKDSDVSLVLQSFEPFRVECDNQRTISCRVYMSQVDLDFDYEDSKLLSDISIVWGDRFTFYETEEYYWTLIQYSHDETKHWKMRSSKDFSCNTIYCGHFDSTKTNFISWYCMVAFAQSCIKHNCVLFHASVVVDSTSGYAFLGKSGTGKSTHSRLWLANIEGFTLLNDDNPAVRVVDEQVFIYGTPWSGKTKCYINDVRPLKGLVRLRQAPENIFEQRKNKDALLAMIPSCSAIRWNSNIYSSLINILLEILGRVPIAELKCLPNAEAAQICYMNLKKL